MDPSDKSGANMSSGATWCSICNVNFEASAATEHSESRTHLNRCLQKGIGISLGPSSGDKSSTWCSVCNQALETVAAADEHYESRTHLNKCLQRGVGIPLTYATSAPITMPAGGPRFTQAGAANPHVGLTGDVPSGSSNFRPGFTNKMKPRMMFPQGNRPTAFGAKKFPVQPFVRGQAPSNPRMSGPYSGGYGQEMQSSDNFSQYDNSWQSQPTMKNGWPYCDICEQNFQTVGALSQHCSSSGHMEMKMMKQNQYHGPPQGSADQPRFYQGSTSHMRAKGQNQGQYFGNQGTSQQDHYRGNTGQNQGSHYAAKEWRPFNRTVQFLS